MLAAEIAKKIDGDWIITRQGEAFPHPQTRVRVCVEVNRSMSSMAFDESDPVASCDAFAADMLGVISDELCPAAEQALVRHLVKNLIEWQKSSARTDDPVGDLLRELVADHSGVLGSK